MSDEILALTRGGWMALALLSCFPIPAGFDEHQIDPETLEYLEARRLIKTNRQEKSHITGKGRATLKSARLDLAIELSDVLDFPTALEMWQSALSIKGGEVKP